MTRWEDVLAYEARHRRAESREGWLRTHAPRLEKLLRHGHWLPTRLRLLPRRRRRPVPGTVFEGLAAAAGVPGTVFGPVGGPVLVVKTPIPEGPQGDAWGDWSLMLGLARGLARLGWRVRIDRRSWAHHVEPEDSATLVLRGRRLEGGWSGRGPKMIWVISHPDEVRLQELQEFDHVFVASTPMASHWATRLGAERVTTLHQGFDEGLLRPRPALDEAWQGRILFLGNSRFSRRPIVEDALSAGLPVVVVGRHWAGRIPSSAWAAPGVPNRVALSLYEGAGVVLNDHWHDMRRHGFLSNRLFDVVARGTPCVSDPIPGLEEVFGETVAAYRTTSELRRLVRDRIGERLSAETVVAFRKEHGLGQRASVIDERLRFLGETPPGSAPGKSAEMDQDSTI